MFRLIFILIFKFTCITKSPDISFPAKLWWIWIYLRAILPPLQFVETSRPLFTSSEVGVGVTNRKFDLAYTYYISLVFSKHSNYLFCLSTIIKLVPFVIFCLMNYVNRSPSLEETSINTLHIMLHNSQGIQKQSYSEFILAP